MVLHNACPSRPGFVPSAAPQANAGRVMAGGMSTALQQAAGIQILNERWNLIMPFVEMPGLKGKVYVPARQEESCRKHPCRDCYFCQMCSDDRCKLCLARENGESRASIEKQDKK
jgi:hypothetical protein